VRRIKSEANALQEVSTSASSRFITKVLAACRERWEENGGVAYTSDVAAYYTISEYINPLPPGPNLTKLWERSRCDAFEQIENFDDDEFEPSIGNVHDWLSLVSIIEGNEPRFLRQIGFPEKFSKSIEEFLTALISRVNSEPELEDVDACDAETDNIEAIEELGEACINSFPTLADAVADLTNATMNARLYVKRKRERAKEKELEEQAEHEEEPWHARGAVPLSGSKGSGPPIENSFSSAQSIEHVDVAKLFEDL
jgi:hypothetical protein